MFMKISTLERMHCPRCKHGFDLINLESDTREKLNWGLACCKCFDYPIVDGVFLLSLSKGYGGAEEAYQPYSPFLVASVPPPPCPGGSRARQSSRPRAARAS